MGAEMVNHRLLTASTFICYRIYFQNDLYLFICIIYHKRVYLHVIEHGHFHR
jgi:hypothetical protein